MIYNVLSTFVFIGVLAFTSPIILYFSFLAFIGRLFNKKELVHYCRGVLIGIDQTWNASLRGEEDETISSRLGRAIKSGSPKLMTVFFALCINLFFKLFFGQKDHVIENIEKRYLNGAPSDEKWNFIKEE